MRTDQRDCERNNRTTLRTAFPVGFAALLAISATPLHAADVEVSKLKTFGTMGKEQRALTRGEETELFRYDGKGCLTHMWFGGSSRTGSGTASASMWMGSRQPSIDMELFLGHGIGFGDEFAPWGVGAIGKTGHPNGVYNTYRIPFGKSIRVTGEAGPDTPDKDRVLVDHPRHGKPAGGTWRRETARPRPFETVQAGESYRQTLGGIRPVRREGQRRAVSGNHGGQGASQNRR